MFRARWGKALNAKLRILALFLEAVGSHLTLFSSGVTGLELHFRKIKPVRGWEMGYGQGSLEVRKLIRSLLKRLR